ncbi:hypothetical protein [Ancylobacter terrae]|uniref:hypothetical protein n=1 Tax=Ancylobacter sp. sgz301288 TaxID=3342077 RepID=UPI00385C7690
MTRRCAAAALALAYLLVVQAILGGLGHGAHAADRFEAARLGGAPLLCSGDMVMPAGPDGAPARHTPDCCTLGCLMAAGALPAPLAAALPVPDAPAARSEPLPRAGLVADATRSPAQARAPPAS